MQIKTLVAALGCAFATVAASAGSLSTSFNTNNAGRYGMYFDLTASSSAVTLDSFTVNGATGEWGIYYKTGTYSGFETNQGAWTLLGNGTTTQTVETLAIGGLTIGAGQTDAIYVFDFSGYQNYSNGITSFSNDDLTFNGGTGNYGFFDNTLADRNWSGTINYSLSAVPEPAELSLMLAGLGLLGVAARRRRQA